MRCVIRLSVVVAVLAAAAVAAAQDQSARVMGTVADTSGGALPGVSVTINAPSIRSISVVTDTSGRYLTPWLAPGSYNLTFILSGFESRTVTGVQIDAGQTVVLDQQLSLERLTETVQVTAAAPEPPLAEPVRIPIPPRPPKPEIVPVDKDILASVCGPRQPPSFDLAVGKVVSHRDSDRQLMGPGDILRIDAGESHGLVKGQNLVVRRRFHTGDRYAPKKLQTFGEQTSALVQVVETQPDTAAAMVVYACGEILAGDTVEKYVPQPAFYAVSAGTPKFEEPAKIIIGEHDRRAASAGQMMVIDRGIMQGVQRGQRLTIFRRAPADPSATVTIGDGVVVAIRADSATILIERASDAATIGDLVALHR
jgi:hypothetical protein